MNWSSTYILPALLTLAITAHAQPSLVSVRGNIRSCFAVRILDRQSPIDSLLVDSMRIPQGAAVYLMCMASKADVMSASVSIGDVTSLAGTWRRTVVLSADDDLVQISPIEISPFDSGDLYQLIVPIVADTVVIDSVVTSIAWNGRNGGVIAIEARVLVSDSGRIDVSGLGYRGGLRSNNGGSCGIIQPCDPATSDRTGGKGESIRLPVASCTNGHIPWASGGGGGDAHNAGGGGGGNGGSGGRGGNQYVCSAIPGMYGMPGMALLDGSQERVFMGGGGGGGHQNNNVATDGASGGGIVMIKAHTIIGDSLSIIARGYNAAPRAGNDGGGGGGAGGSVHINSCHAELPITFDVSGGTGSMCDGGHGPGGGGGGGRVMLHPALLQNSSPYLAFAISGGKAGIVAPSNTNGAENGNDGVVTALCRSVEPHSLSIQQRSNVGDTIMLTLQAQDSTAICETYVSHAVRFIGRAHAPLTSGLTWFDATQVEIHRIGADTCIVSVTLPSNRTWTLPVLAVLSKDSSTVVSHRAWITNVAPAQECTWSYLNRVITVDACALPIRTIEQTNPLVVRVRQTTSHIVVDVDGALYAPASCALVSVSGEIIATSDAQTSAFFPIEKLSQGAYAVVVDYLGARYVAPVCVYR